MDGDDRNLADFPAVFFHISNFDICPEIQPKCNWNIKYKISWEGQSTTDEGILFGDDHDEEIFSNKSMTI